MDQTLQALGGIVINGLPTFFLVLLLAACVKYLYLKPLDKILAERHRLTEGAREAAAESLRNADSRVAEYETALSEARTEIYAETAAFLKSLNAEQAERIHAARADSESRIAAGKAAVAAEAAAARQTLELQSDLLATQIADSILNRRIA
jgi:F0F1-type ATP synthase membrane subunit b/b'